VLWSAGRISAVLDWDRIRVHALADELIRTCLLTFGGEDGIDVARTAALVRAYRGRVTLTDGELAGAERRMWWLWLSGFWPLNRRYEDGVTTFDHLYVRNAATFRWWTDHRDQVAAAFTGRPRAAYPSAAGGE
jgi:Ser/Thr protein kinase RdoA (MazF antagonist)